MLTYMILFCLLKEGNAIKKLLMDFLPKGVPHKQWVRISYLG